MSEEETKKDQELDQTQDETSSVSLEELNAKLEKLESTNQRLLSESVEWKEKYKSIRDEKALKEKEELVESKNWEELLTREKDERLKLEEKFLSTKKQTLRHKLESKAREYASDAHNINAVLKMLPSELIKLDEDELTVDGVKEAVEVIRQSDPYLFKTTSAPTMETKRPNSMSKEKTIDEMTREERHQLVLKNHRR